MVRFLVPCAHARAIRQEEPEPLPPIGNLAVRLDEVDLVHRLAVEPGFAKAPPPNGDVAVTVTAHSPACTHCSDAYACEHLGGE